MYTIITVLFSPVFIFFYPDQFTALKWRWWWLLLFRSNWIDWPNPNPPYNAKQTITMSEIQEHPKNSSRIHWTDQTTNLETDTANLYKTGLTSQYRSISIKLDTNLQTSIIWYVHTLPDNSFCAATEIIPDIELLFTHKNGCGARFQWRSDAAPRRFRKWSVLYRTGFVPYLGAVWTPVLSPSRK